MLKLKSKYSNHFSEAIIILKNATNYEAKIFKDVMSNENIPIQDIMKIVQDKKITSYSELLCELKCILSSQNIEFPKS